MADDIYRFGEFTLAPRERRLYRGDKSVALSPKAFDTLGLLVRNHGSLVSRDDLFAALWPGIHVSEANLTNIIVLLRKEIGRDAIQTVSKFGYRFTVPVTGEPGIRQEAYASFVRGKELLGRRTPEAIAEARDHFWFCIAHNPQFAAAWAWLGRACRLADKLGCRPGTPDLAEAAFQRAFALDPDLACAHQFYTHIEVDSGHAAQAMLRLSSRMRRRGEDPETLAGLVHVLRCCGLLEESVAAHERALALDSAIRTSVPHTHFLRGDYAAVFENFQAPGMYLDAAAWVALGETERALSLLRTRLAQRSPGFMGLLMISLLAILEGDTAKAFEPMAHLNGVNDPEGMFYLARHCAMLNNREKTVEMIRATRLAGFWCSHCLLTDAVFAAVRDAPEFLVEMSHAQRLEEQAATDMREGLGPALAAKIFRSVH